jgi:hypothetical protein
MDSARHLSPFTLRHARAFMRLTPASQLALRKFDCNPAGASLRAVDVVSTGLGRLPAPGGGARSNVAYDYDFKSANWTSRCRQCEDVTSRRNVGFAKTD